MRLKKQAKGRLSTVDLVLPSTAETFTVYGGAVNELLAGQRVWIWLEGCGQLNGGSNDRIAVMQLASTKPGDDFPK